MLLMRAPLARWAVALLCISVNACSYLIDSPQARYTTASGMDAGDRPNMDGGMDAGDGAPDVTDAEPIEDASPDADAWVEAAVPPDAGECTRHTDCKARIDECLDSPRCNEGGKCEYVPAIDCTECGTRSVCVAGKCREDGIFYQENFESGELGLEWTNDTLFPWTHTTDDYYEGSRSLVSTHLDEEGASTLELTLSDVPRARIDFWARVRGQQLGYETLELAVRRNAMPLLEPIDIYEFPAEPGWHRNLKDVVGATGDLTFIWRYVRRSPADLTDDSYAYIDDLSLSVDCRN